jgi:hypothetical protein
MEWVRRCGGRRFDDSVCFRSLPLADTVLIYPALRGGGVFFNSENQFLAKIHLPSRLEANADVGDGFTDDAARQGDFASADCNEQNH